MQKVVKTEIYKDKNNSKKKYLIAVTEISIKYGNKQKIYFLKVNQTSLIN